MVSFLNFLWGMETKREKLLNKASLSFLNFLWGMETSCKYIKHPCLFVFLNFLWGMETSDPGTRIVVRKQFLNFLWGMETPIISSKTFVASRFLNFLWGMETAEHEQAPVAQAPCFWTSYEGWKPIGEAYSRLEKQMVFELPMRDGNIRTCQDAGILQLVFELPMRDGNHLSWMDIMCTDFVVVFMVYFCYFYNFLRIWKPIFI